MTASEVKKIRNYLSMTQEKFAVMCGVSVRTISGWEKGSSSPRGLSIRRLNEVKVLAGLDIVEAIPGRKLKEVPEKI
jgi:DNA-binding transcriptional regulator YiaG